MGLDQDYSTDIRLDKSESKADAKAEKPVSNAELAMAIRELNKSINQMIKIFEDANQELIDEYQGSKTQLKEKLDEISDQNEKIAQGIVGLADMVHKDTPDQMPSAPTKSKTPENNASGFRWDTDIPELERPPVQGASVQPKHDFDLGFKEDELQEMAFNNKTGIKPTTPDWQTPTSPTQQQPIAPQPQKAQDWSIPAPKQEVPQQKATNWNQPAPPNNWQTQQPWDNAQDFNLNDPFASQDPFAGKPNFAGHADFSLPNPEDSFMPPSMPSPSNAMPSFPQGNAPQPNAWDFNQQQNNFGGQDFPPAVPEPPKKKGLFASLMKK